MAYTDAQPLENIPIKSSAFLGNSLPIINRAFETIQKDIKIITIDKIPDPIYLTNEDLVPTPKVPQDYQVLTYDPITLSWIPSAVPQPGPSIVKSWVSFRAACGINGTDTKILSQFNVDRIECTNRGEFEIFFEQVLDPACQYYAVFATGLEGGRGTSAPFNIDCRPKDRFSYYLTWNKGALKFGSTINAFVFAGGSL